MIPNSAVESLERLGVSRESMTRLEVLVEVLLAWQARMNLISPSTVDDVWARHVVDSAQLLPLIHANTAGIADLGSGAGFPALVLAAIQPATVHMFESNAKKVAFLHEALRQMKINALVHRDRLESRVALKPLPEVQLVTARAFAPLPLLLSYAEPFIESGATALFHKGQDVDAELAEAAKAWVITSQKHSSITDPQSVILEVKELRHVKRDPN